MKVRVQFGAGSERSSRQGLGGPATVSIAAHGLLIALAVFPLGFTRSVTPWGEEGSGRGSVPVTLTVGIPMPKAPIENPVATDKPDSNLPEPKPEKKVKEPEPPPAKPSAKDYQIQDRDEKKRLKDLERAERMADLKNVPKPAPNAIPGTGGRASSDLMGAFSTSQGAGGMGFGGDFGARYGFYVRTVRTCISSNWDRSRVDSQVRTAPKVYVGFDIIKDGTIVNEKVTTSSGIPSLDREALRAVQACSGRSGVASSPHLPPLPSDFTEGRVSVEVWFEFTK